MLRETKEIELFMIWFPLLNHLRRLGAQVAAARRIIVAHDRQVAGIGRPHDCRLPGDHRRQAGGIAGASGTVDRDGYGRLRRSQTGCRSINRRRRRRVGCRGAAAQRERQGTLGDRIGETQVLVHGDAKLEYSSYDHEQDWRNDCKLDG